MSDANQAGETEEHRPIIFLSWGGRSSKEIARTIKPMFESRFPTFEVFFSEMSIDPGDDPSRRMLEEGLLKSRVLVALLTAEAADRAWVIWETAAAWARGQLVLPVFVDVEPSDVPGPLVSKAQGVHIANRDEMDRLFATVARRSLLAAPTILSDSEFEALSVVAAKTVIPTTVATPSVVAWEDTADNQDPNLISDDARPGPFRMAGNVPVVIVKNNESYPLTNVNVGWGPITGGVAVVTANIPNLGPSQQRAIARPQSLRGWPPAAISLTFSTRSGEVWEIDPNGVGRRLE